MVGELPHAAQLQIGYAGQWWQVEPAGGDLLEGDYYAAVPLRFLVVVVGEELLAHPLLDEAQTEVEPEQVGLVAVDHLLELGQPAPEEPVVGAFGGAVRAGIQLLVLRVGRNIMPSYAAQVDREERWAIINYIRVLQKAKNATESELEMITKESNQDVSN